VPKKEETTKKKTGSKSPETKAKSTTAKKKAAVKKEFDKKVKEVNPTIVEETVDAKEVSTTEEVVMEKAIIQKDNVKDYKKIGYLLIGLVAIILILAIGSSLLGNKTKTTPNFPVVFLTDDDELQVMGIKNKEPIKVEGSYEESVKVSYANNNTNLFMYMKKDSLYYFNIKKSNNEKIANDVSEYHWSSDDKRIIYLTDEGSLYVYNMKDKEKLDSDVEKIYYVTDRYVIYEKDDNIYSKNFKSKKSDRVKIASDAKIVNMNEKETEILIYELDGGKYDFSVYNIKKDKSTRVINNATNLIDYSEDFKEFIYIVAKDGKTMDISKILNDDMKDKDENVVVCDYDDYYDDKCTRDEYYNYSDVKYDIQTRNDIREFVKEDFDGLTSYDVYYIKNEKETKLVEGANSVLAADYKTKRVVYTKQTLNSDKTLKISDYTSVYTFESDIEKLFTMDLFYKQNKKDAYAVENDILVSNAYIKGNELYYTVKKDSEYELFYAKISGAKVKSPKKVDDDLYYPYMYSGYEKGFIYGVDYSSKHSTVTLKVVKNGKVKEVAKDVLFSSITISENKNQFYFLHDYDDEGILSSYTGKTRELAKDIHSYQYINDKLMYVEKDYSSSSGKFDLYMLRGKKLTKIANDVVDTSY